MGLVVALALAISASDASIAGIAAWKIILAAAGAVIFVATGKASASGSVKDARGSAEKKHGPS